MAQLMFYFICVGGLVYLGARVFGFVKHLWRLAAARGGGQISLPYGFPGRRLFDSQEVLSPKD